MSRINGEFPGEKYHQIGCIIMIKYMCDGYKLSPCSSMSNYITIYIYGYHTKPSLITIVSLQVSSKSHQKTRPSNDGLATGHLWSKGDARVKSAQVSAIDQWEIFRKSMENLWKIYGKSMENQWKIYG